jgi:hypothetical protein
LKERKDKKRKDKKERKKKKERKRRKKELKETNPHHKRKGRGVFDVTTSSVLCRSPGGISFK